ncbi:uncharacterized protein At5g01610-like [Phalaenopsis equestris]|uniref:uncharacterized protein At5g01610-like n=1 Tax=Phalaenopsis equestris TaxID=78828 RepID=UPI0009E3013A|nr:uncharacterized protein At5g01610-like [Phalaenopsis equestris]
MSSPSNTLPALLLLLLFLHLSLGRPSNSPSAYEILEGFGFPKGILPEGVISYQLDEDGGFQVLLPCDCEFRVEGEGYLLKYARRITGKVKSGQLKELNGVSVRVLVVWFGIKEVVRSGTDLYFYVGPLSASFPLANFEECPKCSCGSVCSTQMVMDS